MPEVQVSDRVFIKHYKYQGDNQLVVAAIDGDMMTLRDTPEYYYAGIPLTAVTEVNSTLRLRREKLWKAFGSITHSGEMTENLILSGISGFISYCRPDGGVNCVKIPETKDNKELWIVTSFTERSGLVVPKTLEPKDIEIRHVRPFEIRFELANPKGEIIGRDRDKELNALSDKLELMLQSMVMQALNSFKGTRAECLEQVESYLGHEPTWVFDGDEMLEELPEAPGMYLCGVKETGNIHLMAETDKVCVYADSRRSSVIKVLSR